MRPLDPSTCCLNILRASFLLTKFLAKLDLSKKEVGLANYKIFSLAACSLGLIIDWASVWPGQTLWHQGNSQLLQPNLGPLYNSPLKVSEGTWPGTARLRARLSGTRAIVGSSNPVLGLPLDFTSKRESGNLTWDSGPLRVYRQVPQPTTPSLPHA